MSGVTKCSVVDCQRPRRSPGQELCETHYYRVRRNGSIDLKAREDYRPRITARGLPVNQSCCIEQCPQKATNWAGEIHVCRLHWKRWSVNGSFESTRAQNTPQQQKRICCVADCERLEDGWCGMCKVHDGRRRRGSADVTQTTKPNLPKRELHPQWSSEPSYRTVHQRIRKWRGSARHKACACGQKAAQWAYLHTGVNERTEIINGTLTAYSLDVDQYEAMCVSCHKRFDMARIKAGRA